MAPAPQLCTTSACLAVGNGVFGALLSPLKLRSRAGGEGMGTSCRSLTQHKGLGSAQSPAPSLAAHTRQGALHRAPEELRGCPSSSTSLLHPRDTQGAEQQQQFSAKHFVPVGKAWCTLSQLHPRTAPMASGMGSSCGPHPILKGAPNFFHVPPEQILFPACGKAPFSRKGFSLTPFILLLARLGAEAARRGALRARGLQRGLTPLMNCSNTSSAEL